MDRIDSNASSEIAVNKDDIIEKVAEKILNSKDIINVTDSEKMM